MNRIPRSSAILVALLVAACHPGSAVAQPSSTTAYVPSAKLTPGEIDPRLTEKVLFKKGFTTKDYRPRASITNKLKKQVMVLYHVSPTAANMKRFEGDHLISIEIGGATSEKNFWPEPWHYNLNGKDAGAVVKDQVENAIRKAVKLHKLTLSEAQKGIAKDWIGLYKRLVAPSLPTYPFGHGHLK